MHWTSAGALFLAGIAGDARARTPQGTSMLELLGRYETGIFDEGAAEIVAHDPASQRLFVVNGSSRTVDVIDVLDPTAPTLVQQIDLSPFGERATSVSAFNGVLAVAVAADPQTAPGTVAFLTADGVTLAAYAVGALPDMLTFTPDGSKVIVACEGEPDGLEAPGAIAVIDVSGGVGQAVVHVLGFEAFDPRVEEMRAKGVRIFPGALPSLDFEPEYAAVSPDGALAFVTLQEANAFAVVDLTVPAIADVVPLGTKDHLRGLPAITGHRFPKLPVLGTTATIDPADPSKTTPGQDVLLGGFSGLWHEGVDPVTGHALFVTVPDRGPNGEPTDVDQDGVLERPFVLPDYQARVQRFSLNPANGRIVLGDSLPLWRQDGVTPITGLPNAPSFDEEPVDLWGNALPYDAFGADLEGVVVAEDGSYWMCDEYRPAIYHFDAAGVLIDRLVPIGTAAAEGLPAGAFGTETLPAVYATRRPNRGFEAIAYDAQAGLVYAFVQSPLANPSTSASDVIRVLGVDVATGLPAREHVYLLEAPDWSADKVDKIGDAVYAGGGRFFVLERDASIEPYAKKYLFEVDLLGATNLLDPAAPALLAGKTLEQHTPDDLAAIGVRPLHKRKVVNAPSAGYLAGDKTEGLALLPDGRLAILNDNDFGLAAEPIAGDGTVAFDPTPTPIVLGLVEFPGDAGLDPSDEDDAIAIAPRPVRGLYMPDALSAFETQGELFFIGANEGDVRDEDARVRDLVLDPTAFPDPAIQDDEELGRLTVSTIDGDQDGDGDHDALHAYGARSFSIWDRYGNLVWDSGDDLERILEAQYPEDFNSNNTANQSFDSRSDDKGPEPEAVTVFPARGRVLAVVGLERMGGLALYDVTDPRAPQLLEYRIDRDFSGDPELGTAGDLGPEGVIYVPRAKSPIGVPLLVVANEVSGTTTIYRLKP